MFDRYDNPDDLALHHAIRITPGTISLYAQQLPQRYPGEGSRGDIVEWSRKSRRRMMRRVAELDYAQLMALEDRGWTPSMITLTLPDEWERVAPTNAAWMAHVTEFRKRFARKWGHALIGLWKKEFQGRGAPHLHVYTCVPPGTTVLRRVGHPAVEVDFGEWARLVWADIVAHPNPEHRRRHRERGVHVDTYEGMRASNPRRLAKYFLKHSAPGEVGEKEYQHRVPEIWHERPGRFWGYWGLEVVAEVVELSRGDFDAARRVLRRQSRTQTLRLPGGGVIHQPRIRRTRVKRGKRWRWTTKRAQLFTGGRRAGGFVLMPDSPSEAAALARWLSSRRGGGAASEGLSGVPAVARPSVRPVSLPGLPGGLVVELVPPPRPEPPETRPVFRRRSLSTVWVPPQRLERIARAERVAALAAAWEAADERRIHPPAEPAADVVVPPFAQAWWAGISRHIKPLPPVSATEP